MVILPCYLNLWLAASNIKIWKSSANFTKFFGGTYEKLDDNF